MGHHVVKVIWNLKLESNYNRLKIIFAYPNLFRIYIEIRIIAYNYRNINKVAIGKDTKKRMTWWWCRAPHRPRKEKRKRKTPAPIRDPMRLYDVKKFIPYANAGTAIRINAIN